MKMKSFFISSFFIAVLAIFPATAFSSVMHPKVNAIGANGQAVSNVNNISDKKTCNSCHDVNFINTHNSHVTNKSGATCIDCHIKVDNNKGVANLGKRIQVPSQKNCSKCHGIVGCSAKKGLVIPFSEDKISENLKKKSKISLTTGEIFSYQKISNSFINIRNKKTLEFPWDTHCKRELSCISCHSNKNRLTNTDYNVDFNFLKKDPRAIKSIGDYLHRPDHNLTTASCTSCHDPYVIHKKLPYKKKHMASLECQSCHVPKLYGPAIQSINKTVVSKFNQPVYQFRMSRKLKGSQTLSTNCYAGYKPFLIPYKTKDKKIKIAPFNIITTVYWQDSKNKEIPYKTVQAIFMKNGKFKPEILTLFDKNGNKQLEDKELKLDSKKKIDFVKKALTKAGYKDAKLVAKAEPHKINHDVYGSKAMTLNCDNCHSSNSQLKSKILLSYNVPEGTKFHFDSNGKVFLRGDVKASDGNLYFQRDASLKNSYVLGSSRVEWLDIIGFWIFVLGMVFALGHGTLRFLASRKQETTHEIKTKEVYMYRFFERLWHWLMALGILTLLLTGFEIHYNGSFNIFGLSNAITIHNILAVIIVINAVISLIAHIASGEIKQFFGFNKNFIKETIIQSFYYMYGIFKGEPHPLAKTVGRKLNPLQQLTYLALLNFMIPFQIVTGILIWAVGQSTAISNALGGLVYLGPIHNIGAWLFITFVVIHVYLTTTGHTPLANIKAMINGHDEVEDIPENQEMKNLLNLKTIELIKNQIDKVKNELKTKGK